MYLTEKKNVVDMDLEPNDEYYNDLLKFWRKHKIYMGKEMMSTIAEAKGKITFLSIEKKTRLENFNVHPKFIYILSLFQFQPKRKQSKEEDVNLMNLKTWT